MIISVVRDQCFGQKLSQYEMILESHVVVKINHWGKNCYRSHISIWLGHKSVKKRPWEEDGCTSKFQIARQYY